jgi:flagellar motor protein MotB
MPVSCLFIPDSCPFIPYPINIRCAPPPPRIGGWWEGGKQPRVYITPLREGPSTDSDDFSLLSESDEEIQEAREQEERGDEEEEEKNEEDEQSETEEEEEREKRGKNEEEKEKKENERHHREFSDISEEEIEHGMVSKTLYHHFFITFHKLQDAALVEVGDVAGELAIAPGDIFSASPRGETEFVSK